MTERTASISYDENNAIRLCKVIENTFHFPRKLLLMLLSAFVAVCGVVIGLTTGEGLIMLALGCIMFMNTDMSARAKARRTLAQLRGYIPSMKYTFSDSGFRGETDRENNAFDYGGIVRLVDDGKFLYMFRSKESAFMIDKSTIQPPGANSLKEDIAKRAGLGWTTSGNILNTGLLTLINNRKNTRR